MPRQPAAATREQIVDASLELAAAIGWDNLRLFQVADRLGLPLAAVHAEFRDREAIADAWFERALAQVLAVPAAELAGQPPPERLQRVMMRLVRRTRAAPSGHRRDAAGKAASGPSSPLGAAGVRPVAADPLVPRCREIASTGYRRQLAEIGLTALFLAALGAWLRDRSGDLERHAAAARAQPRARRPLARAAAARPRHERRPT